MNRPGGSRRGRGRRRGVAVFRVGAIGGITARARGGDGMRLSANLRMEAVRYCVCCC